MHNRREHQDGQEMNRKRDHLVQRMEHERVPPHCDCGTEGSQRESVRRLEEDGRAGEEPEVREGEHVHRVAEIEEEVCERSAGSEGQTRTMYNGRPLRSRSRCGTGASRRSGCYLLSGRSVSDRWEAGEGHEQKKGIHVGANPSRSAQEMILVTPRKNDLQPHISTRRSEARASRGLTIFPGTESPSRPPSVR